MIDKIKNSVFIFAIVIIGLLASRDLFKFGYFPMHDDLQMMRQLQMEKCFSDGQIPCRWTSDMAYGYGYPLFNFYPPLPYLIGQGFRTMGFPFTDTAKYTFALSIVMSGITMFLFAKRFFGKYGGFVSAVFYVWAPYHAVDVYVRGAMNESWALVWFPLVFLSVYELLNEKNNFPNSRWGALFSFSLFCLLTSHNLMVLIFAPVVVFWLLFRLVVQKVNFRKYLNYAIYGFLGIGMAGFFTFPALFENKYTQVKTQLQGYYDYSAHFVSIYQMLLSRFWGFGPSLWGTEADRMPFPVGHFHWIVSLIVLIFCLILIFKKPKILKNFFKDNIVLFTTLFLFAVGWFSAFMVHQKSAVIWQAIPQLRYLQFPWRFLTLVIFSFSFIAGFLPYILQKMFQEKNIFFRIPVRIFTVLIFNMTIIVLIIFNWNYFKVETIGPVVDKEKFSGLAWELQQTAGIYDYLPVTSKIAPNSQKKELVEIMEGSVQVNQESQGSYWLSFNAKVESENAKIRLNVLDFPDWKVFSDNRLLSKYIPEEEMFGRIWFDLPDGEHRIYAQLFNTPIRTISNFISLISWIIFLVLIFRKKDPKLTD